MAIRPVFVPCFDGSSLVEERFYAFSWNSGFSVEQKKKNISALHLVASRNGLKRVLEISSKSDDVVGRRLSAFSLKIEIGNKKYPLESVYQGCKVFEEGGPYEEIFDSSPLHAKRFVQSLNFEKLVEFNLLGRSYPIVPTNAFYDWLYIKSIKEHADWIKEKIDYDGFTDIEFNPKKQFNCQARAFAEYMSLLARGKLDRVAKDFEYFVNLLDSAGSSMPEARLLT